MKTIVLYSSKTGNTKKVGQAIREELPEGTLCVSIEERPADLSVYDLIFLGGWVDRGVIDGAAKAVIEELPASAVALFLTLGASPLSDHAKKTIEATEALLPSHVNHIDTFICQGKVDPFIIEMMNKKFPRDSVHGPSPQREAMLQEAAKHPDETDLEAAKTFAHHVWEAMDKQVVTK